MRWCASRCSSPTGRQGERGTRCWRRSASSPRSNSPHRARQTEARAAHARYFAGASKPTSWRCGTAPAATRPTPGSPSNWPTCAPLFAGLPTTAISTSPPQSPHMPDVLGVSAVENYEPVAWAEELIEPARAVDHPRLVISLRDGVAVLVCAGASRRPSATAKRARRLPQADAVNSRSASKAYSAMPTWPSVSPIGRSSGAAHSSARAPRLARDHQGDLWSWH